MEKIPIMKLWKLMNVIIDHVVCVKELTPNFTTRTKIIFSHQQQRYSVKENPMFKDHRHFCFLFPSFF